MLLQEAVSPVRVDRLQHFGCSRDLVQTESCDDQEPDNHDRPESPPDLLSPIFLEGKQPHQNQQRQQQNNPLDLESTKRHRGLEERVNDLKPLHRREYRDRRRDHTVTENQRRSEDQEQTEETEPLATSFRLTQESLEGKDATLTFVRCLQHVDDVLDRHNAGQRPKEQGHDTQHVSLIDSQLCEDLVSLLFEETLLNSVQHRSADIAVDDAESAKSHTHQSLEAQFLGMATMGSLHIGRHFLFPKSRPKFAAKSSNTLKNVPEFQLCKCRVELGTLGSFFESIHKPLVKTFHHMWTCPNITIRIPLLWIRLFCKVFYCTPTTAF